MKTKEIDVWVDDFENLYNTKSGCTTFIHIDHGKPQARRHKAKLIIEIPEQKIEITESQLEKAINTVDNSMASCYSNTEYIERVKVQLGFKHD